MINSYSIINLRQAAFIALSLTCVLSRPAAAANYADSVVSYTQGSEIATDFGSGLPYNLTTAALGMPSFFTPGPFGAPVDPFNPPWQREQLLSIGTGGSLTVRLSAPVANDPFHPFGLDFMIFGSAGLIITNGDFTGGGISDGTYFGASEPGSTRVSVSADNATFYLLDTSLAPVVDGPFATDGTGDFSRAVNPAFINSLSGKTLTGLRELYAGSAGGAGLDIAWARDSAGAPVFLDNIQYVRIDVFGGSAEIDGFSAVPEPGVLGLLALGTLALAARKHRRP